MTLRIRFLVETCDDAGNLLPGQDREVIAEAEKGELLTQVAYRAGVLIQQTCGGSPSCTDCRVTVKEGSDNAFQEMEHAEKALMGNVYFITKERLACQAHVQESCTVWVPNPKRYRKKQQQRKP
jgi:ferredoxin